MSGREFRRALALVSARLRGDREGERVLTGERECGCRPLIAGLLLVAESAIGTVAEHDKLGAADAADVLNLRLRTLPEGTQ